MSIGTIVILVVLAALVFWVIALYNGLVALRNHFKNAYSQIDVQLKRRYDLIPNLVETAKRYLAHEKDTLEAVISARNSAASANQRAAADPSDEQAVQKLLAAEGVLTGAIGRLFALSENYPDLKANETMSQLMGELSSTEDRIAFSRQTYNDAVMSYNIKIESVPDNFIANFFHFRHAQLFEVASPEERKAVKIQF